MVVRVFIWVLSLPHPAGSSSKAFPPRGTHMGTATDHPSTLAELVAALVERQHELKVRQVELRLLREHVEAQIAAAPRRTQAERARKKPKHQ